MIAAALALVLGAAGQTLPLEFWTDAPGEVSISQGGVTARAATNHEMTLDLPQGLKRLTVKAGACSYSFTLSDPIEAFREEEFEGAPVRLYLSDAYVLYLVPPDLGMQSPPNYLEPKQLGGFPFYPEKAGC